MKKLILSIILLSGANANAQQLLEVLKPVNTFTPSDQCLELVYDKNYGDGEHDFIYCAVQGPGKRIWLNHNLGAEYTRVGSSVFNPKMVPTRQDDENAYGSLFQMGRKADGHELVSYSYDNADELVIERVHPYTSERQDKINSNNSFVYFDEGILYNRHATPWHTGTSYFDGTDLWSGKSLNNPCPTGYRLPDYEEMKTAYAVSYFDDENATKGRIAKFRNLVLYAGPIHAGHDNQRYESKKGSDKGIGGLWVSSTGFPSVEAQVYDKDLYEWLPYSSSAIISGITGGWKQINALNHLGHIEMGIGMYRSNNEERFTSAIALYEGFTRNSMPVRCIKDNS